MNLKLEIRRNDDGIVASDIWPNWDFNVFWWEEGNASCDCNRELFFLRARGESNDAETECGYSRYSVRLSDTDTGAVLYNEIETPSPQTRTQILTPQ